MLLPVGGGGSGIHKRSNYINVGEITNPAAPIPVSVRPPSNVCPAVIFCFFHLLSTAMASASISSFLLLILPFLLVFPFASSSSVVLSIDDVDAHTVMDLVTSGAYSYLDVRTAEEFYDGHIKNAVNVPYLYFTKQGKVKNPKFLEQVLAIYDKNDSVVVGCLIGTRSLEASKILVHAKLSPLEETPICARRTSIHCRIHARRTSILCRIHARRTSILCRNPCEANKHPLPNPSLPSPVSTSHPPQAATVTSCCSSTAASPICTIKTCNIHQNPAAVHLSTTTVATFHLSTTTTTLHLSTTTIASLQLSTSPVRCTVEVWSEISDRSGCFKPSSADRLSIFFPTTAVQINH